MATPNSTGVNRRRARLDGNRPRTHPSPKARRTPAREPCTSDVGSRGRDLQWQLAEIIRRLKVIGSLAVTAEVALRRQNCEQDADIAECVRHGVVDALTAQIERLSQFSAPFGGDAP
jgi:hypothetical protein